MRAIKRFLQIVLILVVIVIGGAIAYAFSGLYDVSVGTGHTAVMDWYLDTLSDRSIERRAGAIEVPELEGDEMIAAGAVAYNQACAGCHGRPGQPPSESFDPRPPALTRGRPDPAEAFWAVRNGIKMSAMPARGEDRMSDEEVWAVVAFLQTASTLTEGEYRELVEPPPEPVPEPADADAPGSEQPGSEQPGSEESESEEPGTEDNGDGEEPDTGDDEPPESEDDPPSDVEDEGSDG